MIFIYQRFDKWSKSHWIENDPSVIPIGKKFRMNLKPIIELGKL